MAKKFRDFKSAREFAIELRLKDVKMWYAYCKLKKPIDIPYNPERTYKNKGWISWGDFLGTGNTSSHKIQFRDFKSSREFARSLGLKSKHEWDDYCKSDHKPEDIPTTPYRIYKNKGWVSMGDWLGTGRVADQLKEYRDFKSAREFARKLKLKGSKEWYGYCKSGNKPDDIPALPSNTYKNKGWASWGDWLGTGNISNVSKSKQYLPFKDAREEARKLAKQYNIKNWKDWQNAVKKGLIPKNIPSNPYQSYSKRRKKKTE